MTTLSEAQIIDGCKRNDRIAQKMLFFKYKNAMYTTALRIVNNPDLAHDVLQEAFLEVFENMEKLRKTEALAGWIKIIVVRKALYKLKGEKTFEPLSKANEISNYEWHGDFTAEELEKAIRNLPTSARAVFLLIEVEGYKHAEVADMLGISTGTSKSQLNYSKQLLQKYLLELNRFKIMQQ